MPPLARAATRDARRAVARAAAGRPVVAVGLAALTTSAPFVGLWAGHALAASLGPALVDPSVTRALLAGLSLTGLACGAALGLLVPGIAAHGLQVAASPASGLDRALAVLGLPLAGALAATGLLCGPVLWPVTAATPGGVGALAGVMLSIVAALCGGGAAVAADRAPKWRTGALRRLAALLGPLVAGCLPALLAASSLAGGAPSWVAVAAGLLAIVSCAAAWGRLLAGEELDVVWAARSRTVPLTPTGASALVAGLLLTRPRDLRRALRAALAIGLGGVGLALAGGSPPPSATVLASGGAAITAVPCALAVGAALRRGAHVWSLAAERGAVVGAWLLASAAAVLTPPLAAGAVGLAADRSPVGVPAGLALVVGIWAAAVGAGTLVPWRSAGVVDQAASLAVCAAACLALALLAALVGPRAEAAGVPGPLIAVAVLGLATAGGSLGVLRVLRESP